MSSRAAQRRARKRAREGTMNADAEVALPVAPPAAGVVWRSCARYDPDAPADGGSAAATANQIWSEPCVTACGKVNAASDNQSPVLQCSNMSVAVPAASTGQVRKDGDTECDSSSPFVQWSIPMPGPDSELFDGLKIAMTEARAITGRKYRYGSTLLAGDDCIPLKSGSNKKVFLRGKFYHERCSNNDPSRSHPFCAYSSMRLNTLCTFLTPRNLILIMPFTREYSC